MYRLSSRGRPSKRDRDRETREANKSQTSERVLKRERRRGREM